LVEGEDGRLASQIKIGGDKIFASDSPQITEVHPAIYLDPQETTATLWVKTSVDMNTVNKVQAILTNENDKPTEYQGAQTQKSPSRPITNCNVLKGNTTVFNPLNSGEFSIKWKLLMANGLILKKVMYALIKMRPQSCSKRL